MKKKYSQIELFFRSLIFSIYSVCSIFIYSFMCLGAYLLPLQYRHYLIRVFLRAYLRVLKLCCHIDYRVQGLENIPRDMTGVVLSKHQSTYETFLLPLIFHDPAIIVKRELLWVPFFGWGLAASDPIAINRSKGSSAMQQIISKGKQCLDAGRWVMVFPEGTRIPVGEVGQYKLGGPRLAAATGYPVIPVAHNSGYVWPRRKFIKQPGTVTMVIGPPISSVNRTPEEILALTKEWIETTVQTLPSIKAE